MFDIRQDYTHNIILREVSSLVLIIIVSSVPSSRPWNNVLASWRNFVCYLHTYLHRTRGRLSRGQIHHAFANYERSVLTMFAFLRALTSAARLNLCEAQKVNVRFGARPLWIRLKDYIFLFVVVCKFVGRHPLFWFTAWQDNIVFQSRQRERRIFHYICITLLKLNSFIFGLSPAYVATYEWKFYGQN